VKLWRGDSASFRESELAKLARLCFFWPLTNVHGINFDLSSRGDLEIDAFNRSDPTSPRNADSIPKKTEWVWMLQCQEGVVSFRSVGFSITAVSLATCPERTFNINMRTR
jgi:hypothetical protein